MNFRIIYIYQNCFIINHGDESLLFDIPSSSFMNDDLLTLIKKRSGKRINIFFSHEHPDHFNDDLAFLEDKDYRIFIPENIRIEFKNRIYLSVEDAFYKDDNLEVRTIKSNDEGVAYIIKWNGIKLYFGGDLAKWYWDDLSDEEYELYINYFNDTVDRLKDMERFDIVFSNSDKRVKELSGAIDIYNSLNPNLFVPMHLFGDTDVLKILPDKKNIFKYKKSGDSIVYEKQ